MMIEALVPPLPPSLLLMIRKPCPEEHEMSFVQNLGGGYPRRTAIGIKLQGESSPPNKPSSVFSRRLGLRGYADTSSSPLQTGKRPKEHEKHVLDVIR